MSRSSTSPVSRILSWLALLHALAFMAFWLTNSLFYASTNDYLVKLVGLHLDYVSLLLLLSALLATWSVVRLALSRREEASRLAAFEAWLYAIVAVVYVIFFYGSFQLLFKESPVQLNRLGQLLGYFRIILDTVLLLGAALLMASGLRRYLVKKNSSGAKEKWLPVIFTLLAFAILWSLPLVFPPGSVVHGILPEKPKIIAHRGASMVAPENTLIAMQSAARLGVYGLETDIRLSSDGELFLMHDDTFSRTTDVQSVFPGRENERVESFAYSEVAQLNAGKWFVEQDPFAAIKHGLINSGQVDAYQQQTIPTLAEMLEIVRSSGQVFIFDLKQPPEDNPYANSFFEACLDQIRQAGIDPQVWFLVDEAQLQKLRQIAPAMKVVYGANYHSLPEANGLLSKGYQIVNVEYGISRQWIREYQDAGLWVNIYTIDEPWQYSRLWLLGVNSITSSNAPILIELAKPVFSMSARFYTVIWGVVGLVGLVVCLTAQLRKDI